MNLAPALIQDASSGDQQAFVLLVEPLLPDAFRLAVGMLRSESDAEDAVQDVVVRPGDAGSEASTLSIAVRPAPGRYPPVLSRPLLRRGRPDAANLDQGSEVANVSSPRALALEPGGTPR